MVNYLYNGVELPALPEYDTEHYEAAIFYGAGFHLLLLQEKGRGYKVVDEYWDVWCGDDVDSYPSIPYQFFEGGADWVLNPNGDMIASIVVEDCSPDELPMVWTNSALPVMNMDTGEVLMTASEPVPVGGEPDAPTEGASIGQKYMLYRMFPPHIAKVLSER